MQRLRTRLRDWRSAQGRSGFALIAVLWICGLLAVVTTALVLQVRTSLLSAQRDKSMSQLGSIANTVTTAVAADLAALPQQELVSIVNGRAKACRWSADITVVTSIQDQAGLVDLNTAPPALMTAVLTGVGVAPNLAAEINIELLDFRDQDQTPAGGDPATEAYASADFQPKNAPFELVEELDQIPSISDELLQQIAPFVTVHSQQTGFDRANAPASLLAVLGNAGLTEQALQTLNSPSPLKTFAIDVRVIGSTNRQYGRRAMVSLLRQPDRPYALLSWSRLRRTVAQDIDIAGLRPCLN
jgi:type II secretory pathway component PulK